MSLVLLDRDGVINVDTPLGIMRPDQLTLIDGAAAAIAQLNQARMKVAIITNQSVVGKGLVSERGLQEIHAFLQEKLAQEGAFIDAIYWCGDAPEAAGPRRKPNPGMLQEALADFGAIAHETPMVGDALRDMRAAYAAGCPAHLVRSGKGVKTEQTLQEAADFEVTIHDDLPAFVASWLSRAR